MYTTTDYSAIEKLLSSYGDKINASDVSKTLELYTQNGTLMPQGAPAVKGKEQLKSAYESLFKAFQLKVEYVTDEVIVNGDYAFAKTHSVGSTLMHANGQTIPVDNKELFVLHKNNGEWKISHYIFNNNKLK